jgi:DNA-directed RNA polymerase subunit H (RpoH/RPB5)
MSTNNLILRLLQSRKNILNILENHQNYNVDDYKDFDMSEVDVMYKNEQLDMLLENKENTKKTYIKYLLSTKAVRTTQIDQIIEDLYQLENVLEKKDTLIIILFEDPNENLVNHFKHIYNSTGVFIVIHTIRRLQFNILEHDLVPEMVILDDEKIEVLKDKYFLNSLKELPDISRFDPQALAMSMRPGEVGQFTRKSPTSLTTYYYRICV